MGLKQQQVGKEFEYEIMEVYSKKGYFTYHFPTEIKGTVCDILVMKNSGCMFIECKHTINDKLYYKGCGIFKKRDELDRFVKKYNTNIYIMIKSEELGHFWTTWLKAKPVFEEKGYLDLKNDCYNMTLEVENGEI